MASLVKINSFSENLAEKLIDLGGAGLTIALTNTAHDAAWDELADLTQVSYTNLSSRVLTVSSSAQASGTYKLVLADLTLTSTGGSTGPFRYIYVYDDSSTGDKLCWYYDYGSEVTVTAGNSFIIDFSPTNGAIQIA
jgi:hypothetical protein